MLNEKEVERIKKMYPSGTRIKLNYMEDDYGVTSGTYGIVDFVDDAVQTQMIWDNGRTTALIVGIDSFEVVDIPNEKRVVISLTYVYGIGLATSKKILAAAGVSEDIRVKDLTSDQEDAIRREVDAIKVEGDLRREVNLNIKRLMEIGSYRGIRHRRAARVPRAGRAGSVHRQRRHRIVAEDAASVRKRDADRSEQGRAGRGPQERP